MSPLSLILLAVFLLIIVGYSIGAFFLLYHLIRFGIGTGPKQIALVFMVGSVILLFMTALGFAVSYPVMEGYVRTTLPANFDSFKLNIES